MRVTRADKLIVLINCCVPAALLAYDALTGGLGANPVNFAIRTTGLLALIYLVGSLAITPLARLTGANWLIVFRRTLGLCAFFHAVAHLAIFFIWDRALDVESTLDEMVRRPYLIVGSAGLALMAPLAATSTEAAIRRMGPRRWKQLHRLAYASAALACLHYYMLVKADVTQPVAFAIVLGVLLAFRVAYWLWHRQMLAKRQRSPAVPTRAASRARYWKGTLRVVEVIDETPDVRTFRLGATDGGPLPFAYLAGQYLNLALTIDGRRVNRSYTIASSPTRGSTCEITVKRDGVASRFLHEQVLPGVALEVGAPAGRFTFEGDAVLSLVLIAGGVGITPLMSKVRYLTDTNWPGQIFLACSARTARDIIFRAELEMLAARQPNLHMLTTLTRADDHDDASQFARGRLTAAALAAHVPTLADSECHLCGPDAMIEPVRLMLRDAGVPDGRIKHESFTPAAGRSADADVPADATSTLVESAGAVSLTFARSAKTVTIAPAQTILEAAEDAGVAIDFDCRSGICGQCRIALVSGDVVMETRDALSKADRAAGLILACQARCVAAVAVDA